ncbi:hypothetical protein JCM10908_005893 [Rhodotorula pacifica]|uniref:uncharacterized protein n=1 Tax=Rhodotorula pacifica TaxID=1495444 RepID=UPI00316F8588
MLANFDKLLYRRGAIRLEEEGLILHEKAPVLTKSTALAASRECTERRLLCESLLASAWIICCREIIAVDPEVANYLFYRRLINVLLALPILAGCASAAATLQAEDTSSVVANVASSFGCTVAFGLPWALILIETIDMRSDTIVMACGALSLIQITMVLLVDVAPQRAAGPILAACFTLVCLWLTFIRYCTPVDLARVGIKENAPNAAMLIVPLLVACVVAASAITEVKQDSPAMFFAVWTGGSAIFALPWAFLLNCISEATSWQAVMASLGLGLYQVSLVLWSLALAGERAERKRTDTLPLS